MRKALVGVVGTVLLLSALPADTQVIDRHTTGTGSFQCTVALPVWPTSAGPPVTCSGRAILTLTGTFDTGGRYVLTGVGVPLTANASGYSERCTLNEPLNGFASGAFTISGLSGSGGGATVTGSFEWIRIGAHGGVRLPDPGRISFNDGRTARWISDAGGDSLFRPVTPATGRTCSAPGPLTAHIVGGVNWYL